MKKNLFRNSILLIAVLFASSSFAQNWVNMMQDPNANFYETQQAFYKYYNKAEQRVEREKRRLARKSGQPVAEGEMEVPGFEQFKRWEWFMQPRVGPNGERFAPDAVWNAMNEYKKGIEVQGGAGNWTLVGPTTSTIPAGGGGAGRTNFITVHPTNALSIWTGTPGGGLWHSTDGGSTWSTNTDQISQVIGCTDLAIDPNTPNTMYLGTGDGEGGNTYSVGLLKTTDGGSTWNTTGLSFNTSAYKQISKIIIDPSSPSTLYVATSGGIYKSTNSGASFTLSLSGAFKDIEFKPGTLSTLYCSGTEFYYTTNSGGTWTKVTAVLAAAANVQRMAIAVSNNNPAVVYVLTAKAGTYDLEGLYKSTNSGVNFTKLSVTPNLTGMSSIIGNQGFYALAIAANPSNANEVVVGGLDVYKCTNVPSSGTAAFTQMSSWVGSGTGYVHADIHELEYNGSNLFSCCDGGVFKSSNGGSAWSDISNGLQISQPYGFGQSQTNSGLLISGWQDNGTVHTSGGSWTRVMGGDGMYAFISHGSDVNQWGSSYYGQLSRSTNSGVSFTGCTSGITEYNGSTGPGPWAVEWNEDLTTANTLYAGYLNVWKNTSGGSGTWVKLGNLQAVPTPSVYVQAIAAAPTTNGQVILAAKGPSLYRTTNGGSTWTVVSGLPAGTISDIAFHPTDPNKAWLTYTGYSNVNKVFQSTNQGAAWTNISGSIPNIPVDCITIDKTGNDAVYIGTDAGVFFKDASMTVWQPFSNLLPSVVVSQLDVFYGTPKKIRASTYGRGIWESTLYAPGTYQPDANFAGNVLVGCPGLGVQFSDYSSGQPNQWAWSFPGGNPSSSTAQNPFVAYNTPGTYSVTLTATNTNGNNSQTYGSYITINSSAAAPTAAGLTMCGPATVSLTATPSTTPAGYSVRWWNQPAGGSIVHTGNTYSPSVNGTDTFYVDESFASTGIDVVGAANDQLGAGALFTANDIRGLYFDVTKPVKINSVKVYSGAAGPRTIEIIDANGNWVTDTTLNVANSGTVTPTTVNINRTVYPGTGYMIKFRGTVNCYRNSAGASYPYTDGGSNAITITNSNAGLPNYYYFFYDWSFTNIVCNTGRTTVIVKDTCSLQGINDVFVNNHLDIFPNPNNGQFNVSFQTEKVDNYTVKVTNTIGQTVYEEKLTDFSGTYSNKIDIKSFGKGIYMLSVSNSGNEMVKKVMVY